jgi:hypothetical protein
MSIGTHLYLVNTGDINTCNTVERRRVNVLVIYSFQTNVVIVIVKCKEILIYHEVMEIIIHTVQEFRSPFFTWVD